jgi:hypothetical protein
MRLPHVAFSVLLTLCAVTLPAGAASAQSVQEFENAMSGSWDVSAGPASDNKACKLVLSKDVRLRGHAVESNDCHGALSSAATWGIAQKQLAIYDDHGTVIVAVGGNQHRLTGKTAQNQPVEFLRPTVVAASDRKVQKPSETTTASQFAHAMAGEWIVQQSNASSGASSCKLNLKLSGSPSQFDIDNTGCSGELARVVGWSIENDQLALRNSKGENFVLLGGNQFRLSGKTTGGDTIVLVRANPPPVAPAASRNCAYLGYTSSCASPPELGAPAIPHGGSTPVRVLVKLNLRIRPEPGAPVVRVLAPNTCVAADRCEQKAGGLWCHAKISGVDGWIKKEAVRLNRWTVVTFLNHCSSARR